MPVSHFHFSSTSRKLQLQNRAEVQRQSVCASACVDKALYAKRSSEVEDCKTIG